MTANRMRKFLKLYDSMPEASQDAISFALKVIAAGLGIPNPVENVEDALRDDGKLEQNANKQVV